MPGLMRLCGLTVMIGFACFISGCGSSGPASTEAGAIDSLRSALMAYNAASPTDVASTGTECVHALTSMGNAALLARKPGPGQDLLVRQELHAAYLLARRGFSDCALGATTMNYRTMAQADGELISANVSLRQARSAR